MLPGTTDENFVSSVFEQMKGSQRLLVLSEYRLPLSKSRFLFPMPFSWERIGTDDAFSVL